MSLVDETHLLEDLMNAQTQMRDAAATIDRIANRVHGNAAALSNLERERLRQQTRANTEAVKADNAAEEIAKLRADLDAAMALLREIRNTSGIGLNCGIYERMGFADKSTLERIEAMLEKAEKP
jgi:hypothetical protein